MDRRFYYSYQQWWHAMQQEPTTVKAIKDVYIHAELYS